MHSGFRGPGDMRPPDFQQRALEIGAGSNPSSRGLFLRNYWRTRRRGRAPALNPLDTALADYLVAKLMAALRYENPGINVRLPSHISPPFRSVQWSADFQVGPTAAAQSVVVPINGQTVVPEGVRGVVNYVAATAYPDDDDVNVGVQDIILSIAKNGLTVPGFQALRAGFTKAEILTDIAGENVTAGTFPSQQLVAPIQLEPGDQLTAIYQNDGPFVDPALTFRVAGWVYPIEVEGDGIVGTLADRGTQLPVL